MLRKLSPLQLLAIAALIALTVFLTWRVKKIERAMASHDTESSLLGKSAPDFSLTTLDGRSVSLAEFRGKKKVVISYWASWCGPCRIELPELRDFYRKYHKDDSDFEILAISIDSEKEDAETYAAKSQLPFPVLLDSDQKASDAYDVQAIPAMFIVDKNGVVKFAGTGADGSLQAQLAIQLDIKDFGMSQKSGD